MFDKIKKAFSSGVGQVILLVLAILLCVVIVTVVSAYHLTVLASGFPWWMNVLAVAYLLDVVFKIGKYVLTFIRRK